MYIVQDYAKKLTGQENKKTPFVLPYLQEFPYQSETSNTYDKK
jgi:hypothetical protein